MRWKTYSVSPDASVLTALEIIDRGAEQIALVVGSNNELLGTVTDGDIRRALLSGITPNANVQEVMNHHPIVALENEPHLSILSRMKNMSVRQIPVVDSANRVVAMRFLHELKQSKNSEHWVVLMAGGLGTRLRPLTENVPKPLLEVGNKPILERIIENFAEQGFHRFFVTVHYKAEMVKEHFGTGEKWGVQIEYLDEPFQLGTAGALGLLPDLPTETLLVMNADLITGVNFRQLLQFHREQQVEATMCVFKYNFQVPYGVVRMDNTHIRQIDEKPTHDFFVNAGIYALEPSVIRYVKQGARLDMTTLFTQLIADGQPTAAFPVREEWADIGRVEDYLSVRQSFQKSIADSTNTSNFSPV